MDFYILLSILFSFDPFLSSYKFLSLYFSISHLSILDLLVSKFLSLIFLCSQYSCPFLLYHLLYFSFLFHIFSFKIQNYYYTNKKLLCYFLLFTLHLYILSHPPILPIHSLVSCLPVSHLPVSILIYHLLIHYLSFQQFFLHPFYPFQPLLYPVQLFLHLIQPPTHSPQQIPNLLLDFHNKDSTSKATQQSTQLSLNTLMHNIREMWMLLVLSQIQLVSKSPPVLYGHYCKLMP